MKLRRRVELMPSLVYLALVLLGLVFLLPRSRVAALVFLAGVQLVVLVTILSWRRSHAIRWENLDPSVGPIAFNAGYMHDVDNLFANAEEEVIVVHCTWDWADCFNTDKIKDAVKMALVKNPKIRFVFVHKNYPPSHNIDDKTFDLYNKTDFTYYASERIPLNHFLVVDRRHVLVENEHFDPKLKPLPPKRRGILFINDETFAQELAHNVWEEINSDRVEEWQISQEGFHHAKSL